MSVVRPTAWIQAGKWIHNLINLVSFPLITRNIAADEFGVFAVASTFLILSDLFFGDVMENGVLREHNPGSAFDSTMFWMSAAIALSMAVVVLLLAPIMSLAYGMSTLTEASCGVALVILLRGCSCIPQAIVLRKRFVRQYALNSGASNLVGAGIGIVASLHGAGFWSLVFQFAVTRVVGLVMATLSTGFLPALEFDRPTARRHFDFIRHGFWSSAATVAANRLDVIILGLVASSSQVGLFGLAKRVVQIAQELIASSFDKSLLLLRATHSHRSNSTNLYSQTVLAQAIVLLPSLTGLALTSHLLIPLVFGAEWTAVAPLVSVMAAGAGFYSMARIERAELLYEGRTAEILRVRIMELILAVVLLTPAIGLGVAGFAAMYPVRAGLGYLLVLRSRCENSMRRAAGCLRRQVRLLGAPLVATALMGMAVVATSSTAESLSSPARLLLAIFIAMPLYVVILIASRRYWWPVFLGTQTQ